MKKVPLDAERVHAEPCASHRTAGPAALEALRGVDAACPLFHDEIGVSPELGRAEHQHADPFGRLAVLVVVAGDRGHAGEPEIVRLLLTGKREHEPAQASIHVQVGAVREGQLRQRGDIINDGMAVVGGRTDDLYFKITQMVLESSLVYAISALNSKVLGWGSSSRISILK